MNKVSVNRDGYKGSVRHEWQLKGASERNSGYQLRYVHRFTGRHTRQERAATRATVNTPWPLTFDMIHTVRGNVEESSYTVYFGTYRHTSYYWTRDRRDRLISEQRLPQASHLIRGRSWDSYLQVPGSIYPVSRPVANYVPPPRTRVGGTSPSFVVTSIYVLDSER
ncbi:hypothetical protein J6590_044210 [Homalodisca vitripennis]|nr:hypothetical protein J6590_044210 [Homalodisca vitripennis]